MSPDNIVPNKNRDAAIEIRVTTSTELSNKFSIIKYRLKVEDTEDNDVPHRHGSKVKSEFCQLPVVN